MATLSQPQQVQDVADAKPLQVNGGAIEFRDLYFNYGKVSSEGGKAPVLAGLNLQIKPGEKVGLVGRSGAGKSTLVNLLLRFYDLEQGKILAGWPGYQSGAAGIVTGPDCDGDAGYLVTAPLSAGKRVVW
ncbi:ATP-binding cassette sub-family B member [Daphnia magna]|uniref:ATP-binding cassette sub-family B member n=1 Tax=Daphnia magna TaxID=35525 RepID=A0A164IST5_9CRUS|nr:ATP-binding cassette sub-family B member [Daphnia magna]